MSTEVVPIGEADAQRLTERIRNRMRQLQESIDRLGCLIAEAYNNRVWLALGYDTWDDYVAAEFGVAQVRLERDQRQELVVSLRSAGMSTRAIGSALGVDQSTVVRDARTDASASVGQITGVNGKTYTPPAPKPEPEFLCGDCGELFPQAIWHCPGDGHHSPLGEFECQRCHAYELQLDGTIAPIAGATADGATADADVVDGEVVGDSPEPAPPARTPRRPLRDQFFDAAYDLTKVVDRIGRLASDDRFPRNVEQVAAKHRSDLSRAVDVLADVLDRLPTP